MSRRLSVYAEDSVQYQENEKTAIYAISFILSMRENIV